MEIETLAAALEREHHEIDEGIVAYTAEPQSQEGKQSLLRAIRALRRHIYLEEDFLFPPMRAARPRLTASHFVMLREHGQMWPILDSLEQDLDGSTSNGTDFTLCEELKHLLVEHNTKEEDIFYPVADELLTEEATARLREFLASGELPDGWVCAKAGGARGLGAPSRK